MGGEDVIWLSAIRFICITLVISAEERALSFSGSMERRWPSRLLAASSSSRSLLRHSAWSRSTSSRKLQLGCRPSCSGNSKHICWAWVCTNPENDLRRLSVSHSRPLCSGFNWFWLDLRAWRTLMRLEDLQGSPEHLNTTKLTKTNILKGRQGLTG